jgi:6-phosphofructokinase 1
MIGIRNDEVVYVPFSEAVNREKPVGMELIKVLNELSI